MGRLGRITWKLPQVESLQQLNSLQNQELPGSNRLTEVREFGANPGNLQMRKYIPSGLQCSSPLVVILHGCTQTAESYDRGTGWSALADNCGFALLFPEQKRLNNPNNCFTWFNTADTRRGEGEAASIRSMIARMALDHGVDEDRVFISGLSAGGAMTGVMLATYPEVFAAGAIIAGLSYGSADSMQAAFASMARGTNRDAEQLGGLVRKASPHLGPWPRVSVWHGSADKVVALINAEETVKQWTDVHEAMRNPERRDGVGYQKFIWRNEVGDEVVESVTVSGLAHGTPLAVTTGDERCGEAGPFLLEAGVSSTHHIARFFGVLGPIHSGAPRQATIATGKNGVAYSPKPTTGTARARWIEKPLDVAVDVAPINIHGIILRALRAAGVTR